MTCDAIICDWNGTLTRHQDEEPVFRKIGVDLFKSYFPWHPLKMVHLLHTKKELDSLKRLRRQDSDFDWVIEMFRIYNEKVINGLPTPFIRRSVESYAKRWQTSDKLDYRVLRPVAERHRAGIVTGILSAGYDYGIQTILEAAGYGDCFDFYEANPLSEKNNRAIGFELTVYKNKAQVMLRLLKDRTMDAKRVVYIGDSLDDIGCFELAGYPVVAFLAPAELKDKFAQQYNAFVPTDEADLTKYLQNV